MRQATFMRSISNPSLWCSIMRFGSLEELEAYKATGPYMELVKNLRESWLDESKPVTDTVYEVLDV